MIAEEYNSLLFDEIFESISPNEERKIKLKMLLVAKIEDAMKEYAKLKCEELLKIVAEKAEVSFNKFGEEYVDKESILNAVNLNEFIK